MTAQDQKDNQDRIGSSKGTAFNIVPPSFRPHIHDFGTRWRVHYRQCPPGVPRCCNIEATVPEERTPISIPYPWFTYLTSHNLAPSRLCSLARSLCLPSIVCLIYSIWCWHHLSAFPPRCSCLFRRLSPRPVVASLIPALLIPASV